MRATLAVLIILAAGLSYGAGWPYWKNPPPNCSSPSAACLFANPTVTGALTISGTTAPQIDSTGANPLELRSRATAANNAFQLYAHNSITSGNLFVLGEKASTTVEERFVVDHQGGVLIKPDGIAGGDLGVFGPIYSIKGGADSPLILRGGAASLVNTQRVLSVQNGLAGEQANFKGSGGGMQQAGTPTASLPPCNGSAAYQVHWDTTLGRHVGCDGNGTWYTFPFIVAFDGTQDPANVPANSCIDFTIAATGVVDADVLACDRPAGLNSGLMATCTSGVDVVGWRICNVTTSDINPANGSYRARLFK